MGWSRFDFKGDGLDEHNWSIIFWKAAASALPDDWVVCWEVDRAVSAAAGDGDGNDDNRVSRMRHNGLRRHNACSAL